MRAWFQLLLLIVTLGVYGVEALAAQHHVHEAEGNKTACAACILHGTPAVPTDDPAPKLPAPPVLGERRAINRHVDALPALEPSDVSFATSPPAGARVPSAIG